MIELLPFDNSYKKLPERFYELVRPTPVREPKLICWNASAARMLGCSALDSQDPKLAEYLSGNILWAGSEPLAQAYAGHQFGHFVPQLGDGRAILLGEVLNPSGQRFDVQLKGAGLTRFSRRGDGRYALGPALREYLMSEAFFALGIPTTRSLAVVSTGETVLRDELQPGAILTRLAASHIRIGTFEYFASRNDFEAVKILADYVIARHYPDVSRHEHPYLFLFEKIVTAQAKLIAQWLSVGFIHGVMNTDNMTVSGETIDFGPCAFLDEYDPAKVFSSIDHQGRYAYGNQFLVAHWNLSRLAGALLPMLSKNENRAIEIAEEVLSKFKTIFSAEWLYLFSKKMGILEPIEQNQLLIQKFLDLMQKHKADFTLSFRSLADVLIDDSAASAGRGENDDKDYYLNHIFSEHHEFQVWLGEWQNRLREENRPIAEIKKTLLMNNPYVIPRNHFVEHALRQAVDEGDLSLFDRLFSAVTQPYAESGLSREFAKPPEPHERVTATFCGT